MMMTIAMVFKHLDTGIQTMMLMFMMILPELNNDGNQYDGLDVIIIVMQLVVAGHTFPIMQDILALTAGGRGADSGHQACLDKESRRP